MLFKRLKLYHQLAKQKDKILEKRLISAVIKTTYGC